MYNFNCKFCGKDAISKRSDAVFCSAVCRTNSNTLENKDRVKAYKQQYYLANKEKLNTEGSKRYRVNKQKLPDRVCQNCSTLFSPKRKDNVYCKRQCGVDFWLKSNPEYVNESFRKTYHTNLNRKLSCCLRSRLRKALKENVKSDSTINLLGCTIEELKKHLESKFKPGMSWDNWSKDGWHIDHIKPLASFDLSMATEQIKACHYTNLQPLWAEENISKGDH